MEILQSIRNNIIDKLAMVSKGNFEFLHFCDDQKNKYFVIYSLENKVIQKLEVPYETVYLFDTVQVKNRIYFTGGGMPSTEIHGEQFLQTAVEVIVTERDNDVKTLPNMNVARSNHTLAAIKEKFIYAVGGCNTKAEIPACEVYSIEEKKWKVCASLNEKKMWVSVCTFEDRYLYAFGGSTNLKPKESQLIEYLDSENKSAKAWTKVELTAGKDIWPRCFFAGCFQVDAENILVFGGLVNNAEVEHTYYFNPKTATIVKGAALAKKDAFYRTKHRIYGKEMMIVGSNEGDMHVYALEEKKWVVKLKKTWNADVGFALKSDTY